MVDLIWWDYFPHKNASYAEVSPTERLFVKEQPNGWLVYLEHSDWPLWELELPFDEQTFPERDDARRAAQEWYTERDAQR